MKKVLLAGLVLLVVAALWIYAGASGWLGSAEEPGEIHAEARPAAVKKQLGAAQVGTARLLGAPRGKQILFGDFHVHTCAGRHLAELEMECLLQAMIERVARIEVGPAKPIPCNSLRGLTPFDANFHTTTQAAVA